MSRYVWMWARGGGGEGDVDQLAPILSTWNVNLGPTISRPA